MHKKIVVLISLLIFCVCFFKISYIQAETGEVAMSREAAYNPMKISSSEFQHNEMIPRKFTCQGSDINPALIIENMPEKAVSLALIVDDPDAPMGMWVHWVVFNIPIIPEINEDSVPGEQAMNDFGRKDYGGPCPPSGTHRYFFKIYALDTNLSADQINDKRSLEKSMQGHIIDRAVLIGLYKKS